MAFGRLRRRLDEIQTDVHGTLGSYRDLARLAGELLDKLAADLRDGIAFEIVRVPGASLWQFFTGKAERFPFRLRVLIDEDQEPPP